MCKYLASRILVATVGNFSIKNVCQSTSYFAHKNCFNKHIFEKSYLQEFIPWRISLRLAYK